MDWLLGRMKAWVAAAVPALVTALMKSFEQAMGFDIPGEVEVMILSGVTSFVVYMVPNKTA